MSAIEFQKGKEVWDFLCQSFMIVSRLSNMASEDEIKIDEVKKFAKYAKKILSLIPPEVHKEMLDDGLFLFVQGMREVQGMTNDPPMTLNSRNE